MKRAVVYARISQQKKYVEQVSIEAQVEDCERYCAERGWIILGRHTDILTGRRADRPGYMQMLASAKRNEMDAIICWRFDRFGRDLREGAASCDELETLGVEVHATQQGGRVDRFIRDIYLNVAQFESEQTSQRVHRTQRLRAERGQKVAGKAAFGFRWSGKSLAPHPPEARLVCAIYEQYANGKTQYAITRWANSLPLNERIRAIWSRQHVKNILRNPAYAGVLIWNRRRRINGRFGKPRPRAEWVETTADWPALIDPALWQRVQRRLETERRFPGSPPRRFLLTGLIYCPRCGSRMTGFTAYGGNRTGGYRCSKIVTTRCTVTFSATILDQQVMGLAADTIERANDPRIRTLLARRREQQHARALDGHALREMEKRQKRLEELLLRAAKRLVEGEISVEQHRLLRGHYETELLDTQEKLPELHAQRQQNDMLSDQLDLLHEAISALRDPAFAIERPDVARSAVLAQLFLNLVPQRISRGRYAVHPEWTALGNELCNASDVEGFT